MLECGMMEWDIPSFHFNCFLNLGGYLKLAMASWKFF
jgi:hypothetical protein